MMVSIALPSGGLCPTRNLYGFTAHLESRDWRLAPSSFSRTRRRSDVRVQDWHPERNHLGVDSGGLAGRPEQNNALVHDYPPVVGTNRHAPAIAASSRAIPSTRLEDVFPACVVANTSSNKEEHEPERQIVRFETKTSQSLELTSAPGPTAAWYRMHHWIQTGCAVLVVILVVFFGVTLSRRLQALTEAQHGSQSAALTSQQLTQTEQRAWVGMVDAVPLPLRSNGGGFTVKVQNTGKTPAFDVQFSAVITFADNEEPREAETPNMGAMTPLGTLLPGAAYTTDVWFRTSPEAVRALLNHQQRAVGFVSMTYTDVFKIPHSTRTCFYWYPDLKNVKPCEMLHEMN